MNAPTATWPSTSAALAARVFRRDLRGAVLMPLGLALGAGALLTLLLKAVGVGGVSAHLPLVVLPVLGLLRGLVQRRRFSPIRPSDAAWALDRIADADGRGLAAATTDGPAASEAAWGPGRIDPPKVSLLPPRGLALALGALLLAGVAVLVPARTTPRTPGAEAAALPPNEGPSGAALAEAEAGAEADQARALAAERVRAALGLSPRGAEDPHRVAERLEDPEILQAALDAAADSPQLHDLVAKGGTDASNLAAALATGQAAAKAAEAARRRAVALRAEGAVPPVPIGRRALLERYFTTRARHAARAPAGDGR